MWALNVAKVVIVVLFFITESYCNRTDYDVEDDTVVYKKYIEMDKSLKNTAKTAVKTMLPYLIEASSRINVSSKCQRDLLHLLTDLRSLKLSAVRFLDATGKVPEGMLTGRAFFPGDYEECLETTVTRRNGEAAFTGQYCLVNFKPVLPKLKKSVTILKPDEEFLEATKNVSEFMKFLINYSQVLNFDVYVKFGLCVPTGCSFYDVDKIISYLAEQLDIIAKVDMCDYQGKYEVYTPRTILAICILSCLGFLSFVGTIVEYYSKKRNIILKSVRARILLCFSILSNFPKLIDTNTSDVTLTCLPGIRCLSLFYIILSHEYLLIGKILMIGHLLRAFNQMPNFFFHITNNGTLTTDVFFFLGGLVNCYTRMEKKYTKRFQMIVHRIWRIYPALLLTTFVFPYIFNQAYGPQRTALKKLLEQCDYSWWKNLLFVNIFFEQEKTCMPQTWYVSVDFYLFVMSLFTIPVFFRNEKKGVILHLVVILTGVASAFLWAWHKRIWPAALLIRPLDDESERYWNAYALPFSHISTYYTGILIGYFLHMKKGIKLTKGIQFIGWIVASALFISMLFLPVMWTRGTPYTALQSSLYFSLSKLFYVLAVAWMTVCCVTGHGGIINYILSLKIWIPISRISYMTYLLAVVVQLFHACNLQLIQDYHNMVNIWNYLSNIIVSLLLSTVMVLIAESPFIRLEKILFGKA